MAGKSDLLEALPVGLFLWEAVDHLPAHLTLRYANRAAGEQAGRTVEGLIGRSVAEIFPGSAEGAGVMHHHALAQTAAKLEVRYPDEGIAARWFRNHLTPAGDTSLLATFEDITAVVERERALRESERLNRSVVASLQEGVVVIDRDGIIQQVNDAVYELFHIERRPLTGRSMLGFPILALLDAEGDRYPEGESPLERARTGEQVSRTLAQVVRLDGTRAWAELTASSLGEAESAAPYGVVVTLAEVTDRVERERRISHEADHDPLTGLANRRRLERTLDAAVQRADSVGTEVAVLVLDLNGFKSVNDRFGHAAGDDVLREVARRLREAVRERDLVARLGGDEFVVVVPDLALPARHGEEVERRIADALRRPFEIDRESVELEAAIGVAALSPDDREGGAGLLAAADRMMYRRKSGRS